ncbi:MAG: hypothetical protein DRJ40_11645 [Thermoprotei archaeon]|nr:MAG: hypothetical protein DRJ40_11645 [Thermoprotei archaeon]
MVNFSRPVLKLYTKFSKKRCTIPLHNVIVPEGGGRAFTKFTTIDDVHTVVSMRDRFRDMALDMYRRGVTPVATVEVCREVAQGSEKWFICKVLDIRELDTNEAINLLSTYRFNVARLLRIVEGRRVDEKRFRGRKGTEFTDYRCPKWFCILDYRNFNYSFTLPVAGVDIGKSTYVVEVGIFDFGASSVVRLCIPLPEDLLTLVQTLR